MQYTRLFDAGAIRLGVEYRLLNEEIIAEAFGPDSRAKFGNELPPGLPASVDEDGVSVHVFGADDGQEYLRFDCFDDYPHYHYLAPHEGRQEVMEFDPVADGPMVPWMIESLRTRLPEMLRHASVPELAGRIDATLVEKLLPELEAEIATQNDRGKPITVAES
jgi:hypothetical protein